MRKRLTALLLGVLTALLLPLPARAAGSIDPNREVSLSISYRDQNTPLTGAQFDIFLVATVDAYGQLTTTEAFSGFNVDIRGQQDEAWRALASTLEGYVLRDGIASTDSGKTDAGGALTFPTGARGLEQGLYLVLGQRHSQGGYVYDAAPFLVLLPSLDKEENDWVYDVTASPKHDASPEEPAVITRKVLKVWKDEGHETARPKQVTVQLLRDGKVYDTVTLNAENSWRYTWTELDSSHTWTVVEKEPKGYTVTVTREGVTFVVTNTYKQTTPDKPTTPPGKPTKLPQTGQLWWPVPVLVCAGLLCLTAGLARRRGRGYEE